MLTRFFGWWLAESVYIFFRFDLASLQWKIQSQKAKMNAELGPTVKTALGKLAALESEQLETFRRMYIAYGSALYPLDLLAAAALNRSLAQCSGFRALVEARNYICAAPILRLQIDTALRFFAAFLVDNPHEFAGSVLKGIHVDKLKDQNGKQMRDAYLLSCLPAKFSWVKEVYKKTSGYIHLSGEHISQTLESLDEEERTLCIKVSATDKELSEKVYCEVIEAFCAATEMFLYYVEGWIFTKDNLQPSCPVRGQRKPRKRYLGSGRAGSNRFPGTTDDTVSPL
jgi:hypothetical protein